MDYVPNLSLILGMRLLMHQKAGHRPGHNGAYSSYQHLFVLESLGRTGLKPLPVWDRDADCNPNDALIQTYPYFVSFLAFTT